MYKCKQILFSNKIISVPPKLQSPGNPHQALTMDQRVSIFCSIVDGDEPVTMTWQKDGIPLEIAEQENIVITSGEHDSILRINKLDAHHMGNYSCKAKNMAGTAVIFTFFEVKGMFWTI